MGLSIFDYPGCKAKIPGAPKGYVRAFCLSLYLFSNLMVGPPPRNSATHRVTLLFLTSHHNIGCDGTKLESLAQTPLIRVC